MGFTKKTWKNRIAEYINRRLITKEDGSTELVTVARDEGTISQEGDAFNAANMNDLEDRIESEFNEINQSLTYTTSQDVVIGSLNGKELHRHVYNIIKSDNLQTMTIDTGIKSGDIDCMINIYGTYKSSNGAYYALSHQSSLRCEVALSPKGVELIIKGINAVKVTAVIEYTLA